MIAMEQYLEEWLLKLFFSLIRVYMRVSRRRLSVLRQCVSLAGLLSRHEGFGLGFYDY